VRLPGGEHAVIDERKLACYVLDASHPWGGPKARLFRAALGLDERHVDTLRSALMEAARSGDAVRLGPNAYGVRYRLDFVLEHAGRSTWVQSGWFIPNGGGAPTLVTVFPIRK
jgi:hypothetical protein